LVVTTESAEKEFSLDGLRALSIGLGSSSHAMTRDKNVIRKALADVFVSIRNLCVGKNYDKADAVESSNGEHNY